MQKTVTQTTVETCRARAGRYELVLHSTNGSAQTGYVIKKGAFNSEREIFYLTAAEVEHFKQFFKELS